MDKCQLYCRTIQRLCKSEDIIILPPEYQRVEYLESDGNQYLNIGSIANHQYFDADIEEVAFLNNYVSQWGLNGIAGVNGNYNPASTQFKLWYTDSRDSSGVDGVAGYSNARIGDAPITVGVKYNVYLSKDSLRVDGQECATATGSDVTGTADCYVFTVNNPNAPIGYFGCSAKIYRFETSSVELYPCYRKSDNKPGMYDIVNNTFYTNAGGGEFTVGDNV